MSFPNSIKGNQFGVIIKSIVDIYKPNLASLIMVNQVHYQVVLITVLLYDFEPLVMIGLKLFNSKESLTKRDG